VVQCQCELGTDKEARDDMRRIPLILAADEGHLPLVQYMCEQGADKEARATNDRTPLKLAVGTGHLAVVQYFDGLE